MIRFLLKSAFWLSLAFIAVPHFFPADQENKAQENKPHEKPAHEQAKQEPSSIEQILANGKTAVEIGKLCMDNPSFCKSGTSLVSSAGSGFLEGSRVMLEYLSARGAKKETPVQERPAAAETISVKSQIPVPTPREEALRALDHRVTGSITPNR
ncbi:hypothetical protein CJU93_05975 [Brucella melitensis]|nr:hypothetical protein [Brucella melitensis]OZV61993.1 hypothetical protein BSU08_10150 [Brucella melitensis]PAO65498.1 hypothetical protein CJI61_06450 [Brucella melitensis]PAO83317.1 hypothetical protein CJU93_05975 [Brucella melitensis]PHL02471.1 hypothetical protein BSU05_05255 [Brucella melitensis]